MPAPLLDIYLPVPHSPHLGLPMNGGSCGAPYSRIHAPRDCQSRRAPSSSLFCRNASRLMTFNSTKVAWRVAAARSLWTWSDLGRELTNTPGWLHASVSRWRRVATSFAIAGAAARLLVRGCLEVLRLYFFFVEHSRSEKALYVGDASFLLLLLPARLPFLPPTWCAQQNMYP